MIRIVLLCASLLAPRLMAGIDVDIDAYGESLGGWKDNTVDYALSGANYRTYKPEITPSPDGGIFVSVRIDHRRGWLASDDHAVLEVSFAPDGSVSSAKSTLAIQGRTISSDLIRSSANAGAKLTGAEGAVKVGANLVADLSSKLLLEKIVEAGRVSYPAAVRHNYNLLYQALRQHTEPSLTIDPPAAESEEPAKPAKAPALEIKPYGEKEKK
ncbi:hypothetical protein HAHE_10380 [Haloferula helveola]|uniref:Uncharacterized protein n=1 Tax=Haloferula helveola TaxID=490095 RepID=A0ABM7RHI7_9BACT|nr:hypothetical protein HAHE_10380 [Haloferula helveola]